MHCHCALGSRDARAYGVRPSCATNNTFISPHNIITKACEKLGCHPVTLRDTAGRRRRKRRFPHDRTAHNAKACAATAADPAGVSLLKPLWASFRTAASRHLGAGAQTPERRERMTEVRGTIVRARTSLCRDDVAPTAAAPLARHTHS